MARRKSKFSPMNNSANKNAFQVRRVCRFCIDDTNIIDHKNIKVLRSLITERGKIIPRRISGTCSKHQRKVTMAIKRARNLALLHYTVSKNTNEIEK